LPDGTAVRETLAAATPAPAREAVRVCIRASRWVGYKRARWSRPVGTRPEIGLAVCAIFKNEGSYLAEWVTFHRLIGVERFYLYDNESTDHWRDALAPELAMGTVRAKPWPGDAAEYPVQRSAYSDCLRLHRRDTRWIAFIDVDEFLFSPTGRTLPDVLAGLNRAPGVVVNWRNYGTGGWDHTPEGLVTESYLTRAPDDLDANRYVKSIVYPRKTSPRVDDPHYFRHFGPPVGEDGKSVRASAFREPSTTQVLRINHYYSKSTDHMRRKLARIGANGSWRDPAEARSLFADTVRDETILQFVPALRCALAARGRS
jgi:hypothetical protein